MKITKILTCFILILTFVMLTVTSPVKADDLSNGAKIFNLQCAGCHGGGGNIIRRGKTLKKKALDRNGYDTLEAISYLVSQGKANMPAYKERLTPKEIQDVSEYVIKQAEKNWQS
ncbi:cytochrome c6 PetJ [Limnoraphis robusta]|uniref:cytochrome c6 PetJ n=1 Tax=Limnoraphis robusta TaxID=1118279 RepID=UPI000A6603D6|nr:c-type cytochrome [Limnoraphis robusta]